MRTHVEFRLHEFIQTVEPVLLLRYLESFHEEYREEEGRASSIVAGIVERARKRGFSAADLRALAALRNTPGPLSRLFEGPLKFINDLNCPRGRACLQREISGDDVDIDPNTDPVNAGMQLLLDHRDRLERLAALFQVEQTEDWRMFVGRVPLEVEITEESVEEVAREFSEALQERGLSARCKAEVYRQQERVTVELAHEQYAEALREFRGRDIKIDWRKPVRHARLVYRPSTGVLKVKVFRNEDSLIDVLRRAVGHHCFGSEDHFLGPDAEASLDLTSLRQRPTWTTDPCDEIEEVRVTGLDFECMGGRGATAQFRATGTEPLYDLLNAFSERVTGVQVHGAYLRFKFAGERNTGQRTVHLKKPDSTNLGDDDYDRVIEMYLSRWGLLNAPEPPQTDLEPDRAARDAARRMAQPGSLFSGLR